MGNRFGLDSLCPSRRVTLSARLKIQAMNGQQLEISFDQSIPVRRVTRQRRMTRARWWFTQMRQVVDRAWDWEPPQARPEQVCMPHGRGSN